MAEDDHHRETKHDERDGKVNRDPSAKLVRDLATTVPAKELQTLKAAVDAAEREDSVAAVAHTSRVPRRASR